MVKKIAKFLAYISFFILAIIYFAPKVSLYYLAESKMKPFDVVVTSEVLKDNGFSLDIKDGSVVVKSIESAKFENINIKLLGLYNFISVDNIYLSSTAKSFIPLYIRKINIQYYVLNPLNIDMFAIGEFGKVRAFVDLVKRELRVVLTPSKLMISKYKSSLKNLKKSENGEFTYAKTF